MTSYMHPSFGDGTDTSTFGYQASDGQSLWPFTETGNGTSGIPRSQTAFGTVGMQVRLNYLKL